MSENDIVTFTAEQLAGLSDASDWGRIDNLTDVELEAMIGHDPDADIEAGELLEDTTLQDLVEREDRRAVVSLRVEADVLAFFKRGGPDFERRMCAVLKAYVVQRQRSV